MFNRVNWGAITAGAITGIGITFLFSVILRVIAPDRPIGTDPGPMALSNARAFSAVVAMAIAFAIGGASTVLLGRFQFRSQAALHSLAAFCVAAIAIHFFARGALFIGYPGYPFELGGGPGNLLRRGFNAAANFPGNVGAPLSAGAPAGGITGAVGFNGPVRNYVVTTPIVSWTIALSCIFGSLTSVVSGLRAFRWLEANKIWGERERREPVRKAA